MPRRLFRNALALCAVAVACQDSQEPPPPQSLRDPAAVSTELEQMGRAFASPGFDAFLNVNFWIATPFGGALPRPPAGRLIADEWRGTTFEWDPDTAHFAYVQTSRPGAPPNGVRFILYQDDGHGPVRPFVEVGYVEFLDVSGGNSLQLHVRVRSADGSITYLAYTAMINRRSQGSAGTAYGGAYNGETGGVGRFVNFAASWDQTDAAVQSNASYMSSSPSVSVTLSDRQTLFQGRPGIVVDSRLSRPGELVRVTGVYQSGDGVSLNLVVTVNGGLFARGEGDFVGVTWTKHDNSALTDAEILALNQLMGQAFTVSRWGELLRIPITRLFAPPFPE